MDLLTIGDVAIDMYMKIDDSNSLDSSSNEGTPRICFFHGSKIPVEHFETSIAGNSLNVGVGCTKMGLKTSIYTELGDDSNAERVISELNGLGVDTAYCLKNSGTPTNIHSVIVYGGERTIFSYHEKRKYKMQNWTKPKWIYYTSMGYGFEEFQQELINYLAGNPQIGVAFNPGTIQMKHGLESFKNFLAVTHVFLVNKEESFALVGDGSLEEIHKKLQALGPKMTVITDGKNGASAYDGKNFIKSAIYSDTRPVMDKTGAGDAFSSGFISALYYGKSMQEALLWGTVNSGSVIKEVGSGKGLLNKNQIEEIVKSL